MRKDDHFEGIAAFLAVARMLSFTRAAEELGVTKSAVGKGIAKLERRLGIKLFYRTTRRTSLTNEGEAYFSVCSDALAGIVETEAKLSSRQHNFSGKLRVDTPGAFGSRVMRPILLDMARKYPDLQIRLTYTDHIFEPKEDKIDLAIRFGVLKESDELIMRKLTSQSQIICAAPSYISNYGRPSTVEDLENHWGIIGLQNGHPMQWMVRYRGIERYISIRSRFEFGDAESMIQCALAGLGICHLPSSIVREHCLEGNLVPLLEDSTMAQIDVNVLWAKTSNVRPSIRYLVDQLVEQARVGKLD